MVVGDLRVLMKLTDVNDNTSRKVSTVEKCHQLSICERLKFVCKQILKCSKVFRPLWKLVEKITDRAGKVQYIRRQKIIF